MGAEEVREDDIIFQYAPLGTEDWIDNPHSDYLKGTHVNNHPIGFVVLCYKSKYRRVPKDPLIRAIFLAQLEEAK